MGHKPDFNTNKKNVIRFLMHFITRYFNHILVENKKIKPFKSPKMKTSLQTHNTCSLFHLMNEP